MDSNFPEEGTLDYEPYPDDDDGGKIPTMRFNIGARWFRVKVGDHQCDQGPLGGIRVQVLIDSSGLSIDGVSCNCGHRFTECWEIASG